MINQYMKKLVKLLLCSTLMLAACGEKPIAKPLDLEKDSTVISSSLDNKAQEIEAEYLISSQGIGAAKLGMTLSELKQAVTSDTKFELKSPFMVDIDAIAVIKAHKIQYYILFPAADTFNDNQLITYLITSNPQYQTKSGVRAGTTIREAETIYGNAVLSYSLYNESREYVEFAHLPTIEGNMNFRVNANSNFGGIYPEKIAEYHQTENYHQDAAIASIEIYCSTEDC